jgi:chemotaxis protein histidine kinase CheA
LGARIFEPFFTTKESGSGIGLAVASQTIRDHGGRIRIEEPTAAAEGAEFVVDLPLAAVVAAGALGEVEPGTSLWLEHPAAPCADDGADALIP